MACDSTNRVIELRALLRERFPTAHAKAAATSRLSSRTPAPHHITSHSPLIDFAPGEIREVVAEHPGCGGALLVGELLQGSLRNKRILTLVDGKDSFDPDSFGQRLCRQLLWLRCRDAEQALQSTDLLFRDGNLPDIFLDLQLNPLAELRALPLNVWHRFRGLSEQSGAALIVLTPTPLVTSATSRFVLRHEGVPAVWELPRASLSTRPRTRLQRQRSPHAQMSA